MALNELVNRVLQAVQGDKEAIRKLSTAIVSRDPAEIRRVFLDVAKVDLSIGEIQSMLGELGPDPEKALAYST